MLALIGKSGRRTATVVATNDVEVLTITRKKY